MEHRLSNITLSHVVCAQTVDPVVSWENTRIGIRNRIWKGKDRSMIKIYTAVRRVLHPSSLVRLNLVDKIHQIGKGE